MLRLQNITTNHFLGPYKGRETLTTRLKGWLCTTKETVNSLCECTHDCCTSLPFTDDSVSEFGLWYKRAPKSSYKKCRFAAFLRCLRTSDVLAHTKKNTVLRFYPTRHACPLAEHGPGHEAMALQHCLNYTEGLIILTVEIRTCRS